MRALRFVAWLALAFVAHVLAVRLFPAFPRVVDLFLVVIVLNALDGRSLPALLGGMVAGLVEDAVSGGLYGLHGIAGAAVGYAVARATQLLEVQRLSMVSLLFTLAAALHQALLVVLLLLLMSGPPTPQLPWVMLEAVVNGLVGATLVSATRTLRERSAAWRQRRVSKVRI